MPKMNWGLNPGVVEDFDRSKVFEPYAGPQPPVRQVFMWRLKSLKLAPAVGSKKPQLRAGMEIVGRTDAERAYEGYYATTFSPVADNTAFRYVPFLDAIGVSEREFLNGTFHNDKGEISKIGKWKFEPGETFLMARLEADVDQDGAPRIMLDDKWFGVPKQEDFDAYEAIQDEDEYEGEDEEGDEEDDF